MVFDKRLLWTGVALAAVTAVSVLLVRVPELEEFQPIQEPVSDVEMETESPVSEPEEAPAYAYLLKEYDGRIAVFLPGEEEPETVFDVPVKFLPDYDRMQMAQGIPVDNYESLVSMIEDYIS